MAQGFMWRNEEFRSEIRVCWSSLPHCICDMSPKIKLADESDEKRAKKTRILRIFFLQCVIRSVPYKFVKRVKHLDY